jgi:phosphate starvation-inducible membrane PsiE
MAVGQNCQLDAIGIRQTVSEGTILLSLNKQVSNVTLVEKGIFWFLFFVTLCCIVTVLMDVIQNS